MSIQYPAQGFELMTFWYESSSLTIRPGPILKKMFSVILCFPNFWRDLIATGQNGALFLR